MKKIVFLLFLLPFSSFSQEKSNYTASIDSIVHKINSLIRTKSKSYTSLKLMTNKNIKEEWQYLDDKKMSLIAIKYTIDSNSYTEKYYLQNGSLVYAYEEEIWHYPSLGANEYGVWSGSFYFRKGKLTDHTTLGHGKSESDDWNPEKEILERLIKRKAQLSLLK